MHKLLTLSLIALGGIGSAFAAPSAIRVNTIGYLPDDIKVAVLMIGDNDSPNNPVRIQNVSTGQIYQPDSVVTVKAWEPMRECRRVYFSSLTQPGRYRVESGDVSSPEFAIGADVYAGLNEYPLYYLRQQRCGFNPVIGRQCHQHDGALVLSGDSDGELVDVTGGWHDASDYLQYLTTSANAVAQMLTAYRENPQVWADNFDAAGLPGANNVPDILDEARWGLEWMLKMNPSDSLYLNQIADDRDHKFCGSPGNDSVDYGWGNGNRRPVYPCSPAPYGLGKYKNRSTGLASSVAKFSTAYALGAEAFAEIAPDFAAELSRRAPIAYSVAKGSPGACQTAPCVSPYFYEEDNWTDDLELAAASLAAHLPGDSRYRDDAVGYGRMEPVTPWMGADSARHYQWYPFVNLGHAMLARSNDPKVSAEFRRNMRSGLQRVLDRGGDNAFCCGVPFIWCSNNLVVALVTQAMLYRDITGDTTYQELETSARDWLFGLNPWGKTMVIGLGSDYPQHPHSPLHDMYGVDLKGGLVDGPVYASIFNSLWGVTLRLPDSYADYQNSTVVYHDDYSDYSTNEPTMDGTASLLYMLSRLSSR